MMQTETLARVCKFVRDGTHASPARTPNGVPVLSAEHVRDGKLNLTTDRYTSKTELDTFRKRLHPTVGDVLLTIVGTIGRTAIVEEQRELVFQRSVCVLRPDPERMVPAYLRFALESSVVQLQLERETRQVAQGGVYLEALNEIEVPMCPLSEQKRIAEMLNRADRLRRMRRYALTLSDTFLSATFLAMFGNPATNDRGWKRARVEELGDVQTGNTPPREVPSNYGDYVEWIKSDNLSLDWLHPARATEGLSKKGADIGRVVNPGACLVTCIAGSGTSIGNVCLTDRRVAYNQQINSVTPRDGVLPLFLYGLLRAAKPLIQQSTTLAMKRMITKGKLEQLLLILPPIDQQRMFCDVALRAERMRKQHAEAVRQSQHLFHSLLHQVFTSHS